MFIKIDLTHAQARMFTAIDVLMYLGVFAAFMFYQHLDNKRRRCAEIIDLYNKMERTIEKKKEKFRAKMQKALEKVQRESKMREDERFKNEVLIDPIDYYPVAFKVQKTKKA